jgi:putative oxidoreductase
MTISGGIRVFWYNKNRLADNNFISLRLYWYIIMRDLIDLLGRIFLSAIFIFEAFDTALYMDKTRETMLRYGLDQSQNFFIYASLFLLITGGLMVLFGYRSSLGVFLLMLYWLPVTFLVHDFWTYPKPELRLQSILFMKNMAIIGGLLMLAGKGSGRYSIKKIFATTKV